MDDLTPETRMVVEAARAPRLTRADKARLWTRLEQGIGASAHARPEPTRARLAVPAIVRHSFAGACLLLLALGAEGESALVAPALVAPAPVVPAGASTDDSTAVVSASSAAPSHDHDELPLPATRIADGVAPLPKPRPAAAEIARVTQEEGGAADAAERSEVAALSFELEEPSRRVQPARTRLLESRGAQSVGRLERQPRVRTEFHDKLAAENLARYQAGIAEHARTASIRRPLSSIGGYGAW